MWDYFPCQSKLSDLMKWDKTYSGYKDIIRNFKIIVTSTDIGPENPKSIHVKRVGKVIKPSLKKMVFITRFFRFFFKFFWKNRTKTAKFEKNMKMMAIFIKKHVFFGLEGPRLLKIIRFMGDLAFTTTWLYQGYDCFYDFFINLHVIFT